jgi:YXWGXW repeat-containing protein
MRIRSMLAALVMGVGALGISAVASGARVVELEIGVAPPQERVEVVPAPRHGYIYERGHYVVEGNRYVWVEGRFIREREGHRWHPYVLERHGERWHYRSGHWDDDG